MIDTTVSSTIDTLAQTENVNIDDAKKAIVRAVTQGEKLTQLSLVTQVMETVGQDVATTFFQAMESLISEGVIHSAKGRNGGLKLGPKPEATAATKAAALIASFRKAGKAQ